jgi:polyhydroxybutyrate depolymerase
VRTRSFFCWLSLWLVACEGGAAIPDDAGAGSDAGGGDTDAAPQPDGGAPHGEMRIGPAERTARLILPDAYDGTTPLPLAFLLHGYTATADRQDAYFGASRAAQVMGFYLVLPEGTVDRSGNQFWNATPACCDFGGTGVDDVAYLTALLDEVEARVPVDRRQVYFFGHSNGGFMSYRMACELADRVAAIASLAGSDFAGEMDCVPARPVSVLQIHGDADATVSYAGTVYYPGARAVAVRWARRAGCDVDAVTMLDRLDLDAALPGAETRVERWETGCMEGYDAELWTIEGGAHIPLLTRDWMPALAGWLLRHRRGP